jgi:hypothetical protein
MQNDGYWQRPSTDAIDQRIAKLKETLSKARPKDRAAIRAKLQASQSRRQELLNAQPSIPAPNLPNVNVNKPNEVAEVVNDQYVNTAQTNFIGQNPDQYTDFGSQKVTIGKDGKPVIDTRSTSDNRELLDLERQRDKQINTLANDLFSDYSKRKSEDPRAGLPGITNLDSERSKLSPLQGISKVGLPALTDDFSGERNRIENELYSRRARRLDDRFSRQDEDFKQSLADRGINPGTPLYNRMTQEYDQNKNDAYDTAMGQSIETGGVEQGRLNTIAQSNRSQLFGENQSVASQDAANRNQYFNESRNVFDANLQARNQQYAENQNYINSPLQQIGQLYTSYTGYQKPQFSVGFNGLNQQVFDPSQIYANQQAVDLQREELRRRGAGAQPQAPYFTPT